MATRATRAEKVPASREAKRKKLLLLLIPALAIVVAIQWPRISDQLEGAQEKTQSLQGQVVDGIKEVAPTDATTGTATATTGAPLTPEEALSAATSALASGELPSTDAVTAPAEDELISFSRFVARDPFVQLVDATSSESAAPPGGTSDIGTVPPDSFPVPAPLPPDTTGGSTPLPATSQASISVNGIAGTVAVGDTFPARDPAFTLVAIDGDVVKIGLSDGSFSTGAETLDLRVGESVTLISQPDGARFTINVVGLA
jgi:hypothetical protein